MLLHYPPQNLLLLSVMIEFVVVEAQMRKVVVVDDVQIYVEKNCPFPLNEKLECGFESQKTVLANPEG